MVLSSAPYIWKDIEKLKSKERNHLLRWHLQASEPIHRFSDIRVGDHLVRKGSPFGGSVQYEHHFLCVGFDCGRPKITHYYNTANNAIAQMIPTGLGSGTAVEQLGIVQEMTLPHKDFIKNEDELQAKGREVERVVWPEELQRYSIEEIIARAEERKGEDLFDIIENNCESFVMWCLCNLNITLQATPVRKTLCETARAILRAIWHGVQQIPKMCADLIDDVGVAIGKGTARGAARGAVSQAQKALPVVGLGVGAAVTVLVEVVMAGYGIYEAKKKRKSGVIQTREEFIKEVTDRVLLALCRCGGSIAGMFIGQLVIPIPILGGLAGAVLGLLSGHVIAKFFSKTSTKTLAKLIESIVAKLENGNGNGNGNGSAVRE
ncbi:uncharacterized protein LOC144628673 [Oculina patagonica]